MREPKSTEWIVEDYQNVEVLNLLGPWVDGAGEAIRSEGLAGLMWPLQTVPEEMRENVDLSFVGEDWEVLRISTITSGSVVGVDSLYAMKNLRDLMLHVDVNEILDLGSLGALERFEVIWNEDIHLCPCPAKLEYMEISLYGKPDLRDFHGVGKLKALELRSPKLSSLGGIEEFRSLDRLSIYDARSLKEVRGLETLRNLTELDFTRCRNLPALEELGHLSKVERLHLGDCGKIQSILPLLKLENLKELFLFETNVLDGELAPIEDELGAKIYVRNRKHYRRGKSLSG